MSKDILYKLTKTSSGRFTEIHVPPCTQLSLQSGSVIKNHTQASLHSSNFSEHLAENCLFYLELLHSNTMYGTEKARSLFVHRVYTKEIIFAPITAISRPVANHLYIRGGLKQACKCSQ